MKTHWIILYAALGLVALGLALISGCSPIIRPVRQPPPVCADRVNAFYHCAGRLNGATPCAMCWSTDHFSPRELDTIRSCYDPVHDMTCVGVDGCEDCEVPPIPVRSKKR